MLAKAIFKIILSVVLLCGVVLTATDIYDGYKVYDVHARTSMQKETLNNLAENSEYDFFVLPMTLTEAARVMVPPKYQNEFEMILNATSIEFNIVDENVGQTAALQRARNSFSRFFFATVYKKDRFSQYQRHAEINAYLESLAKSYSNRVIVKTIGKSYEGRDLKTITISNGDGKNNKKVILLDAGIHAREWIAPAAALYVIYQLVENFEHNSQLLESYDWVILPVVNPDGYEYTHTDARFWRKTRKPSSTYCRGTDANRNFDFHWGQVGASSNACADTFKGTKAFSEPETQALRDLMLSLSGRAKMYLTLHSFGKYLLYPWGYTSDLPSNWLDIDEVAQAGAAAIQSATGTTYSVGSSTNVLYAAAGGSDDYALAVAKIPISITMELPGGGSGFNPSEAQIKPFVDETWIGIKAMAENVILKF